MPAFHVRSVAIAPHLAGASSIDNRDLDLPRGAHARRTDLHRTLPFVIL